MSRPRAATFEQQRDAILTTAARLFAQHGYQATSIADLAQACGVSKSLLYHYYRDKEHLLFDIADRYLDSLLIVVAQAEVSGGAPAARLRQLIERFMAAYENAAAYHRVLVQDVKYLSRAHRNRVNAKQRRVVQACADVIATVAPQLARDDLLKPVTMTLFGMINWTFTWLRDDGPVDYSSMAPVVADLFLRGVGAVQPFKGRAMARAVGRRSGAAAALKDAA